MVSPVNKESVSSVRTFKTPSPTPVPAVETPRRKKIPSFTHLVPKVNRLLLIRIAVGLLLLVSLTLFLQYRQAQHLSAGSQARQTKALLAKVGKLIILPTNESPTVATVAHADKLRQQSFFAKAMDGDKVIIYSQYQQAILYRPATNQLVTVTSVNVSQPAAPLAK